MFKDIQGNKLDTEKNLGATVTVDHQVSVFVVKIRSMSSLHPDTLKDLIQTRYEVVDIEKQDSDFYVSHVGKD